VSRRTAEHPAPAPARRGFTLLETLLVIAMISMLMGVMIGGATSLLKGTARSDPEDALLSLMQRMRRKAVETGRETELRQTERQAGEEGPDFVWNDGRDEREERLPVREDVQVRVIGPEVDGAILIGGRAQEDPVPRIRFHPDGTCDRVRLEVVRDGNRSVLPIDPLTCAPLPAENAR
jgi:prepilin-type N-terminal cleavage/methylation domain-containing protein